ncbi:hypothetical protein [Moorena sp. SIO4G3]|uniref:hypothetical protein n=1 Tax=Moorena sp. SIO4G3 TaxID=2607821 RepID=UPI00142A7AEB|nr:hypothetical protein [Moorena sp. SIO4G3]NEO79829.1 hypothetical protein [Moorena sp. SIO4G3]
MGETTAVAHGGNHGKARVGETPFGRLPPQDRTASPRRRCIATKNPYILSCLLPLASCLLPFPS